MDKHWNLYYIFKMDQTVRPIPDTLLRILKMLVHKTHGGWQRKETDQ